MAVVDWAINVLQWRLQIVTKSLFYYYSVVVSHPPRCTKWWVVKVKSKVLGGKTLFMSKFSEYRHT
jgi:hypothetical protein